MGDKIAWSTVHYGKSCNYNNTRFKKALDEKEKKVVELNEKEISTIINYCKENSITIRSVWLKEDKDYDVNIEGDVVFKDYAGNDNEDDVLNYDTIKDKYKLNDKRDIVWIKFADDKHVGVVASSNDINFQLPKKDKDEFDIQLPNGKWKYNSSGIIISYLDLTWDTSCVLVFPIIQIPDGMTRHSVERMIGNYLAENMEIPILDYYSHRIGGK